MGAPIERGDTDPPLAPTSPRRGLSSVVRAALRASAAIAVLAAVLLLVAPWPLDEARLLGLVLMLGMGFVASSYGARGGAITLGADLTRDAEAQLRQRLEIAIGERRSTLRAAESAQRGRDEFLAAVSHELRTPLNSILGFTQVLLSEIDGELTDSQREDLEAIRNAGTYLKTLVDEVLDASSRRTPTEIPIERVDVPAIVRDVARMMEAQRRGKPIQIVVEIDDDVPLPMGDARRVRQIVINLASNAVKFTQRGEVRLEVRRVEHELRVVVKDTGKGIAPHDLPRIFRAYERVDSARARTEGWGLGLAIAREMAMWHGGRIDVTSKPREGSTFVLALPLDRRVRG